MRLHLIYSLPEKLQFVKLQRISVNGILRSKQVVSVTPPSLRGRGSTVEEEAGKIIIANYNIASSGNDKANTLGNSIAAVVSCTKLSQSTYTMDEGRTPGPHP